jgi:hypothetical protein
MGVVARFMNSTTRSSPVPSTSCQFSPRFLMRCPAKSKGSLSNSTWKKLAAKAKRSSPVWIAAPLSTLWLAYKGLRLRTAVPASLTVS